MLKTTEDLTNISEKNCVILFDYIPALINEYQKRFQDLRKIRSLLLAENPWHLETTTIGDLASTNLEVLFKMSLKTIACLYTLINQKKGQHPCCGRRTITQTYTYKAHIRPILE
nr:unnamed protein product [Callosobruchus chinensis]